MVSGIKSDQTSGVEITLSNGMTALIDDEDYPLASQYKWHGHPARTRKYHYAAANIRKEDAIHLGMEADPTKQQKGRRRPYTQITLHRLIMGVPGIDHKNGDPLDCRRENLRIVTATQNCANSRARKRGNSTSQYKGVSYRPSPRSRPWQAACAARHLGYFSTEEEAARAYDVAAKAQWGEYAKLNFPPIN